MPRLDLTISHGALSDEAKRTLPAQLSACIHIPVGALSDRRRGELIREATELIREAAGLDDRGANQIWVLVHEMPEGRWGSGGQVVRFEELRKAVLREPAEATTS